MLLILPLVGLIGCKKDLLNTEPKTSIQEQYIFDTPERILALVNGLYDGVKSGNYRGGRYLIYNDIRGEEFINLKANGVTGLQTWNFNLTSSTAEVENLWIAGYTAINRINLFLKGLEANKEKVTPALFSQYTGEAKFLRALCYSDLITLYAKPYIMSAGNNPGLPLRLGAETTAENNDLARSSVKDVYRQILIDLNEAEANLPAKHLGSDGKPVAELNVTRAHKNTAIALKVRVLLAMGNYTDLITEAQKIVSGAPPFQALSGIPHKLQDSVGVPFSNYLTSESIFSIPMSDSDPAGTQNQLGFYYLNYSAKDDDANAEYSLNTKGIIADTAWHSTDARRRLFIFKGKYLSKFKKPAPFTDYVPVIRYAEVLLNYAEAAANLGDLSKARELLIAVRERSDKDYKFSAKAVDTQDELIKTILKERRIELLGEGFRSFDLLRLGLPIPAKGSVNAIQPTQTEYIWPIPNSEMLANKLMVQN